METTENLHPFKTIPILKFKTITINFIYYFPIYAATKRLKHIINRNHKKRRKLQRSDLERGFEGESELTEKRRIEKARTPIKRRMKKESTLPNAFRSVLAVASFELSPSAIDNIRVSS